MVEHASHISAGRACLLTGRSLIGPLYALPPITWNSLMVKENVEEMLDLHYAEFGPRYSNACLVMSIYKTCP